MISVGRGAFLLLWAGTSLACSKASPSADPAAHPLDGSARTTATATATSYAGLPTSAAPVGLAFTTGMRGTIDGKHAIVMHVVNDGGALSGTYFYPPAVDNLDLHGTLSSTGAVHLDETNDKTPTGAFDGQVDPTGAIAGTWTDAKKTKSLAFHVDAAKSVGAGPVTLVDRHVKFTKKATAKVDPSEWGTDAVCKADVVFPDIVGAFPAAIEGALDATLRQAAMDGVSECDEPFDVSAGITLHTNQAGVLSLEQGLNMFRFGMPHPSYGSAITNVAIPSGKRIVLGDIVKPGGIALIEAHILAESPGVDLETKELLLNALHQSDVDFTLTREGLKVTLINAMPHYAQGAGDASIMSPKSLASVRIHPSPVDALFGDAPK